LRYTDARRVGAHGIAGVAGASFSELLEQKVAEISTPIVYKYRYRGIDDPIVTVEAYAYPDNGSCVIGSITNHIAGND
jgi:hypothetical protein